MSTESNAEIANADRKRWMGILARADIDLLEDVYDALPDAPHYAILRKPETGLVMVEARANGTGRRFNAGEMTVTRCSVRLSDGIVGHAYIAGRRRRHAELAAVFDALMQGPQHKEVIAERVIAPLAAAQDARRRTVQRKSAATKVDFFNMVRGENGA